jgi:hypothetical protein
MSPRRGVDQDHEPVSRGRQGAVRSVGCGAQVRRATAPKNVTSSRTKLGVGKRGEHRSDDSFNRRRVAALLQRSRYEVRTHQECCARKGNSEVTPCTTWNEDCVSRIAWIDEHTHAYSCLISRDHVLRASTARTSYLPIPKTPAPISGSSYHVLVFHLRHETLASVRILFHKDNRSKDPSWSLRPTPAGGPSEHVPHREADQKQTSNGEQHLPKAEKPHCEEPLDDPSSRISFVRAGTEVPCLCRCKARISGRTIRGCV